MPNPYCELNPPAAIKDDFGKITTGFDAVWADMQAANSRITNAPSWMARQAFINGNFDVWQRGSTVTYSNNFGPGNASGYGPDRWTGQVYGSGGGTSTFSHQRQTFSPGQTDVPNNPKYFERFSITALGTTGSIIRIQQAIEGAALFSGGKATLTFRAKSSAPRTVAAILSQNFGSGGSSPVHIAGDVTSISLTTSWQLFTVKFTLPSVAGKTFGSDDNLSFTLIVYKADNSVLSQPSGVVGTYTTGSIDIAQVQLCAGDVALAFQPRSFAEELALCQRYCYVVSDNNASKLMVGFGTGVTPSAVAIPIFFPADLRIPPTLVSSISDWTIGDGVNADIALTSIVLFPAQSSRKSCLIRADVASGITTHRPYFMWSTGASGRLIFDAEL